jgi:hypothetical protein
MHKRQDYGGDDLSEKERLTYFDQEEASVVPVVLAEDPDFQTKSRQIAGMAPCDRRPAAEREAKNYVPNKSAGQKLIVDLLLLMAKEPWEQRGWIRRDFFANLTRKAVWADAPLDKLDGRRARERWVMLEEGARALARRGAGKCIHCGTALGSDRYERGASGARSRRTHCGRCCPQSIVDSELDALRKALDAATGRRRRYRAARRAA